MSVTENNVTAAGASTRGRPRTPVLGHLQKPGSTRVLETSAGWDEVVTFYERCGFALTHHDEGAYGRDAWFARELSSDRTVGASGGHAEGVGRPTPPRPDRSTDRSAD